MKECNPLNRSCIRINSNDYVLEIGSGHNPTYRANVLVDKFVDSNYHRSGDIKIYQHQKFVNAGGENLPFKDKTFDYVICNQVLELADDTKRLVSEICRFGRRGFIEVPSLIGETLFPKKSHKWVIMEIDNKLVFYEKSRLKIGTPDFGGTFLNYLPYQSIALQMFTWLYNQATVVRYEWKDGVEVLVNTTEEKYSKFFTQQGEDEMPFKIYPPKTNNKDVVRTAGVFLTMAKLKLKDN